MAHRVISWHIMSYMLGVDGVTEAIRQVTGLGETRTKEKEEVGIMS